MLGHQIAVSLNICYNCIFFGHDFLTSKYSMVRGNASLFVLSGSENDHLQRGNEDLKKFQV